MVHTRGQRHRFLYAKGLRLKNRLMAIGIAKWHTNIFFGCNTLETRLTVRTRTWKDLNPSSIWFIRKREGCKDDVILVGCIHSHLQKCPACDVHPDADIKDDDVFARYRAWAVCKLWNCDPFVLGPDNVDFEHCTLNEKATRRLRLGNATAGLDHALHIVSQNPAQTL